MKKKVLARMMAVLMATAVCFSFAACGSDDSKKDDQGADAKNEETKTEAVSNDVWKYDTIFGAANYNNQHKYFAKFDDKTGAVYVYATDSQDPTKLTAFAVINVNYTDNGDGTVDCTINSGFVRAMNGSNPIEMEITADGGDTWWTNLVGETKTLILGEDGTLDVEMAE